MLRFRPRAGRHRPVGCRHSGAHRVRAPAVARAGQDRTRSHCARIPDVPRLHARHRAGGRTRRRSGSRRRCKQPVRRERTHGQPPAGRPAEADPDVDGRRHRLLRRRQFHPDGRRPGRHRCPVLGTGAEGRQDIRQPQRWLDLGGVVAERDHRHYRNGCQRRQRQGEGQDQDEGESHHLSRRQRQVEAEFESRPNCVPPAAPAPVASSPSPARWRDGWTTTPT